MQNLREMRNPNTNQVLVSLRESMKTISITNSKILVTINISIPILTKIAPIIIVMLTKYSPIIKCLTKNYFHKLIRIIKIILTNRSNNTENIPQNYNHDDLIQQIE